MRILAFRDASDGRADFTNSAVTFDDAHRAGRSGLRVALIPTTDEAATVAERTVGDTHILRIVVAASGPK